MRCTCPLGDEKCLYDHSLAGAKQQRIANQIALAALDVSMGNMQAAQDRRDDVARQMEEED